MAKTNRPNLYEVLKDDFKVYDSVIDVGCGELYDLINFEYTEFKTLIGIDNNFRSNGFGAYRNLKSKGINLIGGELREFERNLLEEFKNRFKIHCIDFQTYQFNESSYSLIICNKVLHFFNDFEKFKVIESLYDALQVGGLLFIKLNHYMHPNNIDPKLTNHLGGYVYQNKSDVREIRYLVEPIDFLTKLAKYSILHKHTKIDERTITIVICK